ncbi:hypothetical protein BKG69_15920 [Mycobacteroides chelonae]|uniref:SDR family NAD(P)-dependent oxidoreductase n=1 Tax=Mycobacteroides chelonae TaxID=1774 RepID=UPI0008A88EBF|nr:SDR family NAD(P)-dependent oxidoreductase [Mycobacteroides chelonae]OHT78132.1 hypothetical protein BKG69_15920 [Mycobacteroides chelonae]
MTGEDSENGRTVAIVGIGITTNKVADPQQFWEVLYGPTNTLNEPGHFKLDNWHDPDESAPDKTHIRIAGFGLDMEPHRQLAEELANGYWRGADRTAMMLRNSILQSLDTVRIQADDRCGAYFGTHPGGLDMEDTILLAAARRWLGSAAKEALHQRYKYTPQRYGDALPHQTLQTACQDLLPANSDLLVIDTACSSSLYTLDLGVKSLLAGERDIALCGGANTNSRRDLVLFAKLQGLSPHGELRAFDADASGVLFSDATAVVALKLHDRALADGDQILGLLAGFGASADGEGSLMATSSSGQRRAILRARAVNAVPGEAVDWVVAHGTGSRVGDAEELETLNEVAGAGSVLCTANKPMIGHCAWAAGAINVIHAVLAMRHGEIPAERYFTRLPDGIVADRVRIPTVTTPWPAGSGAARLAGVCAYGFGGTNAHLLIQAPDPCSQPPLSAAPAAPRTEDPMVLVGTAVHMPGTPSTDEINDWLTGRGTPPPRSFGDAYPLPPIAELRMPPVSARSVDRTHLMALKVTGNFVAEHGELWSELRETAGVFTAHSGPTRCMSEYTLRVGADDLREALQAYGATAEQLHAMEGEISELAQRLPAPNERSMTGQLTNIIGSMVVNRYRLRGMSMNIDCGSSSTQGALHVAERYLRAGELDFALVIALHGNSTDLIADLINVPDTELAEGAVLLALTRRSTAEQQGWPIQAIISTDATRFGQHTGTSAATGRNYLGADGALATLSVLASGRPDAIVLGNTEPAPMVHIQPLYADTAPDPLPDRSVVVLRRNDTEPVRATQELLTSKTLILTHTADLAYQLERHTSGTGIRIVCTDSSAKTTDRIMVYTNGEPQSVLETLQTSDSGPWQQILIVASARTPHNRWPSPPPATLTTLQECALAAAAVLDDAPDSAIAVVGVLLDPLRQHALHPHLTLITGFLRSLAHEMPDNPVYGVVTDAELTTALAQASRESSCAREYPIAYYRQGMRYVEQLCRAPLPSTSDRNRMPWQDNPVIVATGGARGITAATITELARHAPASLWLLGTTEPDIVPDDLIAAPESELGARRAEFLTQAHQRQPQTSLRTLNAEFDALLHAREIRRTLGELEKLCGADNVHYVVCDLRDREDVMRAAKSVYARHDRIDLLIHGAGRIRSAAVAHKKIRDFREVRDIKIAGYHHLKEAFADPPPALWCNFGSGNALLGCAGDTDYVPANEYLCAAARYNHDSKEFTPAWGLWTETGMVAHIADQLARDHGFTGMSNRQGVAALLSELAIPRPLDPVPLYGLNTTADITASPPKHLLDQPDQRDDHTATWTWRPEQNRDSYLAEHLIDRRPVLPAVMMLAMAAEAALQLHEGQHVRAFTDLHVEAPLFTDVPAAGCRVIAETTAPGVVRVELRSDVTTIDGRVLMRDRRHCHLEVHLGDPPPPQAPGPCPPAMPMIDDDPAVRPDVSAQLSGIWRTLHNPAADPHGASAHYRASIAPDSIFAHLPIPALLLDSTMRLVGYPPLADGSQIMAVPSTAQRIDIYTTEPDAVLTQRHPDGIQLSYNTASNLAVAVTDNETLLSVTGLGIHTVDTVPAEIPYREWRQ